MGLMTFLSAVGKIIEALPIQGRIERLKNELDNLKKERDKILSDTATMNTSKRLSTVMYRIEQINQSLKNFAKD